MNETTSLSFKVDYLKKKDKPPSHSFKGQRVDIEDLVGSLATYSEVCRVIYEEYEGKNLEECLTMAIGDRATPRNLR